MSKSEQLAADMEDDLADVWPPGVKMTITRFGKGVYGWTLTLDGVAELEFSACGEGFDTIDVAIQRCRAYVGVLLMRLGVATSLIYVALDAVEIDFDKAYEEEQRLGT